jgi:copper transport protein
VPTQPRQVIFEFNQAVGGTLGAVRVYDAQGNEVDDLDVGHPFRNQRWMGVGLKPGLPDGTYTATYRVVSADTHVVDGGLIFNIGHAGATPRYTVAGLIGRNRSGRATAIAFGLVRWLDYVSAAVLIGGLVFWLVAWRGALGAVGGDGEEWDRAARALGARLRVLLSVAVGVGVTASVLGVLLQGASAAGTSLWGALHWAIVRNTLEGRFGEVWSVRALDWLLLAAALATAAALARSAGSGEHGSRSAIALPPRALVLAIGLGALYLAVTPALAGHASVESPRGVFLPSDVLHVLAASVWVGVIACALLALPSATRALRSEERTRLLHAVLVRISPYALVSVVVIAITGVVQAYIDVRSVHGLLHTTYGALVIAKVVLLLALIALGYANRERVIPALARLAAAARPAGGAGVLARRNLRGELALMACVLGVTAALVSYAPPIDAAAGPFAATTSIGPAELELTVEPASAGPNTIHMYLIDARTGAQFTATKELTVSARLPAKGIGPLPLRPYLAGPGHYVLNSAVLSPAGTWSIEVVDRVSEFEEHTRVVRVPIR